MSEDPPTHSSPPAQDTPAISWEDAFHLHTFLSLTLADRQIERRELVWIKGFFANQGKEHLNQRLEQIIQDDEAGVEPLGPLMEQARERLSMAEKRQFVYNLAQLCKSKGSISGEEYGRILDIAVDLGIRDIDADGMINSVFSINDTFMTIIGLLALGVILYTTRPVIVPLVIAIFITMIINKVEGLVSSALSLRRFRWVNKFLAMLLILGVIFGLVMAAVVSGKDIATRFPYYQAKITVALKDLTVFAKSHGFSALDQSGLMEKLQNLPIADTLSSLFSSVLNWAGDFFLIVIFTGFLVFSGLSNEGLLQEMNKKTSAYISIKALISFLTGVSVYVLCLVFKVDFALFWATVTFLLNFIPSVGSIIATIPPILLAMVQLDSWGTIAFFGVSLGAVQMVFGNVIEPKLMGDKLAIKPIALLLGLIFWGFLWGIPGMFMAAPLMALLRILSSYFNFSRSFERLLAAK